MKVMNPPNKRSTRDQHPGAETQSARELLTVVNPGAETGAIGVNRVSKFNIDAWLEIVNECHDGVAAAIALGRPETARKIARLYNDKGTLQVVWSANPEAGEREFVAQAWRRIGNENPDMVAHYTPAWSAGHEGCKEPPL